MSAENKAMIRRWFEEVWNKGREGAVDQLLHARAIVHGLGPDLQGPDAFKGFHRAYRNAFPDVKIQIEDIVTEGDTVATRWAGTGTHQGDGLGFPATGKQVQFRGMTFARVENGKLVEGWNSFDELGMLQQLGVVNPPG
jgi:steroid delta-isomerase-like uncharacterized protein